MTARRLVVATAAALGLAAATTACGGRTSTGGSTAASGVAVDKVQVKDFSFKPATITVKAGTTVTWTFDDSASHTVASKTGDSEIPKSPELSGGKSHMHTFAKAGTYGYHCTIHNSMTGTVVVTSA